MKSGWSASSRRKMSKFLWTPLFPSIKSNSKDSIVCRLGENLYLGLDWLVWKTFYYRMGKSPNTFSILIEKRTTDNKTKSNRSPSSSFFRLCIRLFRSGMYSANVHHGTEFRWNPGGPLGCFISFHCRIGGSQELWHLSARAGRSSTLHWKVRKLPT